MQMIDTHAHIYDCVFQKDLKNISSSIYDAGVVKVLLPCTDINDIKDMLLTESYYPELFASMIGIHPDNVSHEHKKLIAILEKELSNHTYVGIGEIGLDYRESISNRDAQKEFLNAEVSLAKQTRLPMSIHVRDAFDDAFEFFKHQQDGTLRGVIHCFTGNLEQAKKWIDLGFKLGIGGIVTFKKSKLPEVLHDIPLRDIVLEADSPYLTPEPHRGKRNDSSYLPYIVSKLSDIYGCDPETIGNATTQNAKSVFDI